MTVRPPHSLLAVPHCLAARLRYQAANVSVKMRNTAPNKHASYASEKRRGNGNVSTHCRKGTASGSTWSARFAAPSFMRRPPQLGQKPRPLQQNATMCRALQVSQ